MFKEGMNQRIPISEPFSSPPNDPFLTWGISPIPVWEKAHSKNGSLQISNFTPLDVEYNTNLINQLQLRRKNSTACLLTVYVVHKRGWRQL
jgi:hypothetical protein